MAGGARLMQQAMQLLEHKGSILAWQQDDNQQGGM
jgi:hypothetical protein